MTDMWCLLKLERRAYPQAVYFYTSLVVDVDILFLGNSKEHLIVEKLYVPGSLLDLCKRSLLCP